LGFPLFIPGVASGGGSGSSNEWAYRSITGTDTALTSDFVCNLSDASFTFTLYTAVGNQGKVLCIKHSGTSLTQVYTLATTGGQTIGGVASGSYALYTNGETLLLQSNGSNWIILDHYAETPWIDSGAIVIGATTTAPTKSTGNIVDKLYWRRDGCEGFFRLEYAQNNQTSAANGSGDYLFTTPANMTYDLSTIFAWTTVVGPGTNAQVLNVIGNGQARSGSSNADLTVTVYNNSNVRFYYNDTASNGMVSSSGYNINTANLCYAAEWSAPMTGWQP